MDHFSQLISNGNPMEALVGFSRAVRVGPYISVGGTASDDAEGRTVGVGEVAAQTRQHGDSQDGPGAGRLGTLRCRSHTDSCDG